MNGAQTRLRPEGPHDDGGEWRRRKRGREGERKDETTVILAKDIYGVFTRCRKLCQVLRTESSPNLLKQFSKQHWQPHMMSIGHTVFIRPLETLLALKRLLLGECSERGP